MKSIILIVLVLAAVRMNAAPSVNTYAAVTNDWYNANFTNVYELAQQRMSSNTNDLVGAYLMLEWNMAFGSVASVSNAISRVVNLSDSVTNQPFRTVYAGLRDDEIEYRDRVLPTISDADVEAERYKSYLPHKKMVEDYMLRQLWISNLW